MKNLILLFFLTLTANLNLFAQADIDTYTNVIPPSPTASSLGTYGAVPVGMFTGTAQLNIPVYTLQSKNLSVPIALNYSSNGIKVDQIASWVGMGWSLNAGGIITRTVKDRADEKSKRIPLKNKETQSDLDLLLLGDMLLSPVADKVDLEPDIYTYNFNGISGKFIIDTDGLPRLIPHQDIEIEVPDTDPNRSFIITTNDGVRYYFGEREDSGYYAVEWTLLRQNNCSDNRPILEQYNTAWYLTRIVHPTGDTINLKYSSGLEVWSDYDSGINQSYSQSTRDSGCSDCNNYGSYKTCVNKLSVRTCQLEEISTDHLSVKFESSPRIGFDNFKLDAIVISDQNNPTRQHRFLFNYIYSNNTSHTNNWTENISRRLFLDHLIETGTSSSNPKKYSFNYFDIDKLPVRLSFSQDHWGYFNGADNQNRFLPVPDIYKNLFPSDIGANREPNQNYSSYGSLKKITYPTGGSTEIDYEAHEYWGQEEVLDPENIKYYSLSHTGSYFWNGSDTKSETVHIPVSQERMYFTAKLSCADEQENPCDGEEVSATVRISRSGTTLFFASLSSNDGQGLPLVYSEEYFTLPGGDLEIELMVDSHLYQVETSFSYFDQTPPETTVFKNIATGGIRVKRVRSKESETSMPKTDRYYYGSKTDLERSSGTIPNKPEYYYESTFAVSCYAEFQHTCYAHHLSSNSANNIYNKGSSHVSYSTVLKSQGENFDNGGEYFKYLASPDSPGRTKGDSDFLGSAYSNTSWNSGILLLHEILKKGDLGELITLRSESNKYNYQTENSTANDQRNANIFTAGLIRRNHLPQPAMLEPTIYCDEITVNSRIFTGWRCIADHKHIWASSDPLEERKCISPLDGGSNNEEMYINHYCYDKNPGLIFRNRRDIISYFDVTYYDILSRWQYLKQRTIRQFDEDGLNPVISTIDYRYDNALHSQLSKTITINSTGDQITKEFYYPFDYNYKNISAFYPLIMNNITGIPIDIRLEVNGKLTSGQLIRYNDKGQVIEIYQSEYEKGSDLVFDTENPYSYGQKKVSIDYDPNTGNIVESFKENDVSSSYIWAYSSTFPIIKAVNIDHLSLESSVSSVLNNMTNSYTGLDELLNDLGDLITNESKELWREFNRGLLDHPGLSNSQITTYTYDPIVGLTSVSDSRGNTTYYEYDQSNRLHYTRDANGNILSKNEYHYKN